MSEELVEIMPEYWKKRWMDNNIGWHRDKVHNLLVKYVHELTGGRSDLRVFVPLCGKSRDMLWLAEQDHNVVGVEVAKQPIESFFEENDLTFSVEKVKLAAAVDPVDVYKCVEKKIIIFCCDLFLLSEEDVDGRFDAIWDRGSLSAMQPAVDKRGKRYAKKIHSLLAADGKYMLETHLYYGVDRGKSTPASISDELLNEIYEEDFILKELEVERLRVDQEWKCFYDLNCHLIKPKKN